MEMTSWNLVSCCPYEREFMQWCGMRLRKNVNKGMKTEKKGMTHMQISLFAARVVDTYQR